MSSYDEVSDRRRRFRLRSRFRVSSYRIEIVPFEPEHYQAAVDAFESYGKGRHKAALNFGDCLTYAVGHVAGMPLLFTGKDFSQTDLAANE